MLQRDKELKAENTQGLRIVTVTLARVFPAG